VGQQGSTGKTEEAQAAAGAVDFNRPDRRPTGPPHLHLQRHYGWFIESGFSRLKRLLKSTIRAVQWANQKKELMLRVVVYNLMLLAA